MVIDDNFFRLVEVDVCDEVDEQNVEVRRFCGEMQVKGNQLPLLCPGLKVNVPILVGKLPKDSPIFRCELVDSVTGFARKPFLEELHAQ